ncbi:MAG: tRNA (adenosine(37)-N6)-dimethylallyltransferase MiaA, partial [Schleiferiaceae bacterium]|nr:tRNA (adenosine(37)-N6)-dimethylallyltransferase MiaA [Schleiferiaceae bacterium]
IGGPTACGKTDYAIARALALQTEIISADSRQFFRELQIGAAPPDATQLATVKHHLVGHLSIAQDYHAAQFEADALSTLETLFKTHDTAIVVGGSGMYINALLFGFDDIPDVPVEIRSAINTAFLQEGLAPLQRELQEKDPKYWAQVDQNNPKRIIRALEVIRHTEKPFSAWRKGQKKIRHFDYTFVALNRPRQELYDRINLRVDIMMEQGLLAEAEQLLPYRKKQALQTVGYRELFDYFDGSISLATAVDRIKQNSRRYAKRQLTWLRAQPHVTWVNL